MQEKVYCMEPKLLSRFIVPVLLLALSPVLAQTAKTAPYVAPRKPMEDKWLAGLKETDRLVRAHQWEAAAKRGREAGEEVVDLAGTGESPAYTLAVVAVLRAIAEAELGHQDEAEWLWDSALNLFPDVAKTNLAPYGEKALALRQRTLRDAAEDGKRLDTSAAAAPDDGKTDPPRIVRETRPESPKALRLMGVEGRIILSS